eukprot:10919124-Lingulodinium_polyedra.AAC.1
MAMQWPYNCHEMVMKWSRNSRESSWIGHDMVTTWPWPLNGHWMAIEWALNGRWLAMKWPWRGHAIAMDWPFH